MSTRLPTNGPGDYPESPWSDPRRTPRYSRPDVGEIDRREPARAPRLPAARPLRGGHRADGYRGEVAPRGPYDDGAGLCRRARRRGVAARPRDLDLRPGGPREPRAGAAPEAAPAPARDRLAVRPGAREGPDARADADVLQ